MTSPSPRQESGEDVPLDTNESKTHHSFPTNPKKVEYWRHGEKAQPWKSEKNFRRKPHAKRADQFGMLLLVFSFMVLVVVALAIYINNKRYTFETSQPNETSKPDLDFYLGNRVFTQRVEEEKQAKLSGKGHEVHGISKVTDDLEVSLSEQMDSMDAKMDKMRAEKQLEEPLPAPPDTGFSTDAAIQLKPTKSEDFQAPQELNGSLPKALQTPQ